MCLLIPPSSSALQKVLDAVTELGVGQMGTGSMVEVSELNTCVPRLQDYYEKAKKRQYRVAERMSVEEIYQAIDSQIHLTFDYLALLIVAGLIAGVGLVANSPAVVVASMLVSPLMFPILGITFGTVIGDMSMIKVALRNEVIGVIICVTVGVVVGALCFGFRDEIGWPTPEMSGRGSIGGLVAGIFVAIPSGAGVAIALTGGISSTLVGVAISAALLPPIVNGGMCLTAGVLELFVGDPNFEENLVTGGMSLALFAVNLLIIYFVALLFFKVKRVGAPIWHRFGKSPPLPHVFRRMLRGTSLTHLDLLSRPVCSSLRRFCIKFLPSGT